MVKKDNHIRETAIISKSCHEEYISVSHPFCGALRAHGIVMCGISHLQKRYVIERNATSPLMYLLFTYHGKGKLSVGKNTYSLLPGSVCVINSLQAHRYELDGRKWNIVWLHLDNKWLTNPTKKTDTPRIRPAVFGKSLNATFQTLIQELLLGDAASEACTRNLCHLITQYVDRELRLDKNSTILAYQNVLNDLIIKINRDLAYAWDVNVMAQHCSLSPRHIHRLIKERYQLTPMKMVTHMRINRAKELLQSSEYSVKQIASMVGYTDYFSFLNAFKRMTGKTTLSFKKTIAYRS